MSKKKFMTNMHMVHFHDAVVTRTVSRSVQHAACWSYSYSNQYKTGAQENGACIDLSEIIIYSDNNTTGILIV